MRTRSPLVLDVRELLENPGSPRSLSFDAPLPDIRSDLAHVVGDVHFELTCEALEGGVIVRADFSGEYTAQCRRCLKPTTQPFGHHGSEIYRPAADVWEEGYAVKDAKIDLEPMTRDYIALNLPANPLCREGCKGLCSRCGADLNEGPCNHDEEIDIRWSALRELARDIAPEDGNGATR